MAWISVNIIPRRMYIVPVQYTNLLRTIFTQSHAHIKDKCGIKHSIIKCHDHVSCRLPLPSSFPLHIPSRIYLHDQFQTSWNSDYLYITKVYTLKNKCLLLPISFQLLTQYRFLKLCHSWLLICRTAVYWKVKRNTNTLFN